MHLYVPVSTYTLPVMYAYVITLRPSPLLTIYFTNEQNSTEDSSFETGKMGGDQDFDWKGEAGDKYAHWNPSDVDGTDKSWREFYKIGCTDVLKKVWDSLKREGLTEADTKVRKVVGFRGPDIKL